VPASDPALLYPSHLRQGDRDSPGPGTEDHLRLPGVVRPAQGHRKVTGYQRLNSATRRVIATMPLELPEQIIETEGLWLEITEDIQHRLEAAQLHFMGAIHALEHAMISLFPLLVLCDRNDIGGISCPRHPQTPWAAVFIYDGHDGGIGLAAEAFRNIDELLLQTERTIRLCPCDNGCPSCVHSPKCGSGNRPIDKQACLALLEVILAGNHRQAAAESTIQSGETAGERASLMGRRAESGRQTGERPGIGALPRPLRGVRSGDDPVGGGGGRVEQVRTDGDLGGGGLGIHCSASASPISNRRLTA